MKTRYQALTIGPVFSTLQQTRSTKAMWSASYLFSWIMREILRKLREEPGITLLNLSLDNDEAFSDEKGVGLFSDRFVVRLDNGASVDLKSITTGVVDELAKKITADLNNPRIQRDVNGKKEAPNPAFDLPDVRTFLGQYLRIYALDFELPSDDTNPVKTADDYLNSLELQASFAPVQQRNYLGTFFEDLFFNSFIEKEFGAPGFPSTLEIATAAFAQHNPTIYSFEVRKLRDKESRSNTLETQRKQEEFIAAIRSIDSSRFKLCHKYIAIVRADGDHIGNLFKTLHQTDAEDARNGASKNLAKNLAENLSRFALAASDKIRDFGGIPVFAGGDDLLFFAPVSTEKKDAGGRWVRSNIFDLLHSIDQIFEDIVLHSNALSDEVKARLIAEKRRPSVSYGVSVSHHKYPLGESLYQAQDQLFSRIKAGDRRNGIAWQITKHSGTGFGCILDKSGTVFPILQKLLDAELPAQAKADPFLASIIYKLEALEGLFQSTADSTERAEHFHHILYNNFNESIHRDKEDSKKLSPFLVEVRDLLLHCFAENPPSPGETAGDKSKRIGQSLNTAYAVLRFAHFLETSDKS